MKDSNPDPDGAAAVLVTGARGLVGKSLLPVLSAAGFAVRTASRSAGDVIWDGRSPLPPGALEGVAAIVHLAGEPIAQRWNEAARRRIRDSRVVSTGRLVEAALARGGGLPDFICASGVSFYGTRLEQPVDESGAPGEGFLAGVARDWEAASAPLADAGGRVVRVRTGVVLSAAGGALAKMLPVFKLGAGGPVGGGSQRMAWISLPDLAAVYLRAVTDRGWSGAVNAVAPEPVTNADLTRTLGRVLGRPTVARVPAFAVRLLFGEMGEETLLADQPVLPGRLSEAGFEWRCRSLEDCLRRTIGGADA